MYLSSYITYWFWFAGMNLIKIISPAESLKQALTRVETENGWYNLAKRIIKKDTPQNLCFYGISQGHLNIWNTKSKHKCSLHIICIEIYRNVDDVFTFQSDVTNEMKTTIANFNLSGCQYWYNNYFHSYLADSEFIVYDIYLYILFLNKHTYFKQIFQRNVFQVQQRRHTRKQNDGKHSTGVG